MSVASEDSTKTNWLEECRSKITAAYEAKTPRSKAMFARATSVLPGGASGNLRYFAPYPIYMSSGDGCISRDVDGNEYIDCFSCNGPLLLGHRHPAVVGAMEELARVGSLVVNPEILVECAELIQSSIPSAERVRFLNSGTEAVMTAIRYARAYTGKVKILKFFGHYHGQDDQFLLGVAPSRDTFGDGIPKEAIENTLTVKCNHKLAFETLMAERDDIAAVIIDPAMHSGGLWGVDPEFLALLREVCSEKGVVLIFDEVITGFRMGVGGAQEYYGVKPDLTTLAKALAAGEKLGVVAGSAEIMAVTDPLAPTDTPRVFQSGTGNDGTMALAAAAGAIKEYKRLSAAGEYENLWSRVERLENSLRDAFSDKGIGFHVNRKCSMMQIFISDLPPSYEAYASISHELLDLVYLALLAEGVMLSLPTSNHIYFSFSHDDAAFDQIEAAVRTVLEKYPIAEAYKQQTGGF